MHKPVTTIFGILLTGSMIMLFLLPFNINIFSNAMAVEEINSYTNNDDYLQRYEKFYKDDSFREAYYNYHKQHHQHGQQQQQQSQEYQKDTNAYDKKYHADTDNYSYNRNYDDYDNYDSYYPGKPNYDSLKTEGTFFVSDAGESHGGFEFTAEYKTEFDVTNGIGTLTITQITGLGDPLEKHVYSITDLQIKKFNKITMNIDEYPVELIFVKNDIIWNHQFDNNYIASWGGFAPENEIKGMISPLIFPGLPDFWYVELRIPTAY